MVVYTPDHNGSLAGLGPIGARTLVDVWRDRYRILGSEPDIRYVMPFENRGAAVGVTLSHPHGQIYGFPDMPPLPSRELAVAGRHMAPTGHCVQCDVLDRERASGARVVAEVGSWIGYVPFWARFPYELRLLPNDHRSSLSALSSAESDDLAELLVRVLAGYDRLFGFPLPYVMAFHQAPTDGGDWEACQPPARRARPTEPFGRQAEVPRRLRADGRRLHHRPRAGDDRRDACARLCG